jgi:hypothetical protein
MKAGSIIFALSLLQKVSPSDAKTEDENVVDLLQKVSPSVAETEDESAVDLLQKLMQKASPFDAETKEENHLDLEYCMALFQRSMHGLHSSIQELEHHVHKLDNIVKQKMLSEHCTETKPAP